MYDLGETTTHRIRCGFCLEACPTFTETGSELESPRERIYLARSVLDGKLAWDYAAPRPLPRLPRLRDGVSESRAVRRDPGDGAESDRDHDSQADAARHHRPALAASSFRALSRSAVARAGVAPLERRGAGGRDASEFLLREGLADFLAKGRLDATITYHDACHLAHGQGVRDAPRELLGAIPGLDLVEMEEADTCCGSAGIYNVTQPKLSRSLFERKWANVEATGAEIVAMGNPECHSWIAQAARAHGGKVRVRHTLEILEEAMPR